MGHAIVGHYLPNCDDVHKISIISRGQALGYTISLPSEDKFLTTRSALMDQMGMTLGGRAAEELVFHEVTTGAANDLEKVTSTAKHMIMRYGMSEKLGPRVLGRNHDQPFLGRDMGGEPDYSEEIAREIDDEIRRVIEESHGRAIQVLKEHMDELHQITELLIERETIDKDQFERLLAGESPETVFVEPEKPSEPEPDPEPERKPRAEPKPRPFPLPGATMQPPRPRARSSPHVRAALLLAVLFAAGCGGSTTTVTRSETETVTETDSVTQTVETSVGLPDAVAQTHAELLAAARSGDYEALRPLIPDDEFSYTFGLPAEDGPIAYWQQVDETSDERTIDVLARILELPYTLYQGTYVWPFAYDKQEGDLSRARAGAPGRSRRRFPARERLPRLARRHRAGRALVVLHRRRLGPTSQPSATPSLLTRAPHPGRGVNHPPPAFDGTAGNARVSVTDSADSVTRPCRFPHTPLFDTRPRPVGGSEARCPPQTSQSRLRRRAAPKLGLALSGGGFRAAFFHVGVLARMAERGLLRKVEVISTVSGGSIVGAQLYLHLKDLHENVPAAEITDEHYVKIVEHLETTFLAGVEQHVRALATANLAKNWRMRRADYSRSDRLGELYDEVFYRPAWDEPLFGPPAPQGEPGRDGAGARPARPSRRRGSRASTRSATTPSARTRRCPSSSSTPPR